MADIRIAATRRAIVGSGEVERGKAWEAKYNKLPRGCEDVEEVRTRWT
jgi:transketolase N-terminal domain/subunit